MFESEQRLMCYFDLIQIPVYLYMHSKSSRQGSLMIPFIPSQFRESDSEELARPSNIQVQLPRNP